MQLGYNPKLLQRSFINHHEFCKIIHLKYPTIWYFHSQQKSTSVHSHNMTVSTYAKHEYIDLWSADKTWLHCGKQVSYAMKEVFRVKKLMGLPPQLALLAVFSRNLRHNNMSEQCNNIYAHTASTSTQFHLGMDMQTQTDCACIFLSLNRSSFRIVSNNLASHAHVIPPSILIVFLRFKT